MISSFSLHKQNFLKKLDKSKKGSIDKKIKILVDKLNKKKKYYTTSSCSGRIVLFDQGKSKKKNEGEWLFVSHDVVGAKEKKKLFDSIQDVNQKENKNCWFRFEPAIMHVNCSDIENAEKLLKLARGCGFKLSGIIGIKKATIEIRSSERIDVPVEIIDPNTLDILIKKANEKMKETHKKINRLKTNLTKIK